MKNSKQIVSLIILLVLGAATLTGTSSFMSLRKATKSVPTTSTLKTDARFLAQAAEINLEEIQMGQLAQKKSVSTDVKELGSMMEKAHTQSLSELTTLANKKGITLPTSLTEDGREEFKELNNKSAKRFNEEYCEATIKDHKKAIELFEEASEDAMDSEIKAWALATLPVLKMHLANAKACKEKCEKM